MNPRQRVLGWLKNSVIFNFNGVNRDRWIERQARSIPKGSRVLDAGAGSCPYRKLFAGCEYKAQDFTGLSGEQLSGGQYGQIDYVCDIAEIPVDDASFDVILCSEVLEHVPEPIKVIGEFARILKPGGRVIITAPLGSGIHQEPYHFYGGYTPFWYEKFLSEAGFDSVQVDENAGSLRACGQESMRFMQLSTPSSLGMPLWKAVLWAPAWVLLLPFLAILAPLSSMVLDKYDQDKRFTVGYHVTALRRAHTH